ncbi:ATP-binding cassette domain-containing protein, partial [Escherichia coli]
MEPFISLGKISKTFYGVKALDNISLTLFPGEVHCLAGQNGCGKST